ncbi:hypothetical protein NN561_005524 [Cricetulus griseus]
MGSSHLGIFFHSKGTQTCGRRVPPTAFWCRQTPGHLEGIPRLPRAPSFWVSPWRPLPPGCAAAAPSPPAGVALGARPAPFRCGLRPRPRLAGFARLRQAPQSLSSRSRRQSLEKWNLVAVAAPSAGLAEPHWACSVAGASAALSRKLACSCPQLIRALSGLRDLEAGADRASRCAGEPLFPPCFQPGDPGQAGGGPECGAGARQPASLAACCLRGCRSVSCGQRRPPSRSPSCSSCRCICSRRPLRSPAHPAPAPQGRCSSCGLAPSLPLLLHSHPQLGLVRVGARTLGRGTVPRRRLRRAKCGWERETSSARPLPLEPACPPGGALLQEIQRPGQRLQGCREPSCPERRRGQSSCPFCKAESV